MTAPIDYNAVLADLLVKRGQIDAAIEVISAMIGSAAPLEGEASGNGAESAAPANGAPTPAKAPAPRPNATTAVVIQSDTFFGLNTANAIKKYLGMMKRPQTAQTITEALMAGGQINASEQKVAYSNVYSALTRNTKDFRKTRTKEWGLAEWYGGGAGAE